MKSNYRTFEKIVHRHFSQSKGIFVTMGALPEMGLTTVSIKIANHLAQTNNVLFLSFQHLKSQIEEVVASQGDSVKMKIKTDAPFWSDWYLENLKQEIKEQPINFVFIDDLDCMLEPSETYDQFSKARTIELLEELANETKCTIVLNVNIAENLSGDRRPRIRDFVWSRNIAERSGQLLGLYRPEYFDVVEDVYGNSTWGRIDFIDMKSNINCADNYISVFNQEVGIFSK